MILVATGTTGFDALAERMDRLASTLDEAVVMQIGSGHYIPRHAEYFRFAPSLKPYYEQASLVVAHGGVGITLEVLDCSKPLVSLSNPDRYDQHQQDLLSTLAAQNHLIWCRELSELAEAIEQARQTTFGRYVKPECTIPVQIRGFLDELADVKGRQNL
jgi:UDP-N-acetylglucosamine transferase subunit ALG13